MADSNKAPPSKLTKFPSEILSDAESTVTSFASFQLERSES